MLHFSSRPGGSAEEELFVLRIYAEWVSESVAPASTRRMCVCVRVRACMRACAVRAETHAYGRVSFSSSFSPLQRRETDSSGRIYVRDDNGTWWISFVGAGEYWRERVHVEAWRVSSKIMPSIRFLTLSLCTSSRPLENRLNLEQLAR